MVALRWEDDVTLWQGPFYGEDALRYAPEVTEAPVSGRLITCVDVVDWTGTGSRDLLLSSWDACYDGKVILRREIGRRGDGTPLLGPEEQVEGVRGYVTAARDGETFHLVSASRMRKQIYVFPNIGPKGAPEFAEPVALDLEADWVRGNEFFHMARFFDIDGDGVDELLVGTDFWDDYWPGGLEWNDEGYRAYDAAGRYLGGPLRGFLYVFKNHGTIAAPKLGRGKPLKAGDIPLEVYGQLAPAFGDLTGSGKTSVIAGEFWPVLHHAEQIDSGTFAPLKLLGDAKGQAIRLDHCIHLPCIVDWDGDGRADILVGAEDGYVTFLKNLGPDADGRPRFESRGRVLTSEPTFHAGTLPMMAAHDFTGNGLPDLVVGNTAGELMFYPNLGPAEAPRLGLETLLKAGGEKVRIAVGLPGSIQGPSEIMFGYTCPTVADWDGDGRPDLLVSDALGHHQFFRNTGMIDGVPQFAAPVRLTQDGRELTTVWRVRPAVVDWTGEGALHYICLDEEARLCDFTRKDDATLTAKRFLTNTAGEPVTFTTDVGGGRGRMKLAICDWEGRGVYDLIVGTHARASLPPGPTGAPRNTTQQAGIFYFRNIGTNEAPVFDTPKPFSYKGEICQMAMHEIAAEPVNWDGSGLGLLVGIEDGSIVWLKREHLSW